MVINYKKLVIIIYKHKTYNNNNGNDYNEL